MVSLNDLGLGVRTGWSSLILPLALVPAPPRFHGHECARPLGRGSASSFDQT